MTRMKPPEYSGIFLEPEQIKYQEVDPPLRNLIRLMSSQSWITTYGCCAGPAQHGEEAGHEHQFFIGLFVDGEHGGINRLYSWIQLANQLNGPTGLSLELKTVHQHPFGQGQLDGWYAHRITAHVLQGRMNSLPSQAHLRMIKCLETAWESLDLC